MSKGYIYIMTNLCLQNMVKIGYAKDVEERRKQLSTTALPFDYQVYATYETPGRLEDKKLHKLIDKLNPDLRVSRNREFFLMSPEDAYDLLEAIATITGSIDKLQRRIEHVNTTEQIVRKPAVNFLECNIPVGAELVFVEDPSVKVTVVSERKVLHNDVLTSLTAVASGIKGRHVADPSYFSYNGRVVADIATETQWRGC